MSLSPDKAVEITSTSSRPSRPHPRSRSRSTFSIEIDIKPTRKSATPHMAARPLPAASTASAVAASSSEVASAAGKDAITLEEGEDEGQEEEHNGEREGVHEILSVQRSAGMEDMYRVVLEEGGRKVQRSRSALSKLAPNLLAAFDTSHPTDASSSPAASSSSPAPAADQSDDASSDAIVVVKKRYGSLAGKGKRPAKEEKTSRRSRQKSGEEEDQEMASASGSGSCSGANNSGDDGDSSMDELSESSASEGSDLDGFIDDDLGRQSGRPSSRNKGKGKKVERESTRHSTRHGSETRKRYNFGDGKIEGDKSESEDSAPSMGTRRSTRRSTRSASRATPLEEVSEEGTDAASRSGGDSSDELSIQAKPRKTHVPPKRPTAKKTKRVEDSDYKDDGGEEEDELDGSVASSSTKKRKPSAQDEGWRPQDVHRSTCTKCQEEPAAELLRKFNNRIAKKKGGRPKKRDLLEEDTDAEEDRLTKLGAWVECGVCCSSYHFGCLPGPQKKELTDRLKVEHERPHTAPDDANSAPTSLPPAGDAATDPTAASEAAVEVKKKAPLPKREKFELDVERTFRLAKCPACKKQGGRRCFVCHVSGKLVTKREEEELGARLGNAVDEDKSKDGEKMEMEGMVAATAEEGGEKKADEGASKLRAGLMFRCSQCKRTAHYGCLENDEPEWTFEQHCQSYADWRICHDCYNYNVPLDAILAWKVDDSVSAAAVKEDIESDDEIVEHVVSKRIDEKTSKVYEIPTAKDSRANAKYLVKWQGMSYRHLTWVPHAWLAASHLMRLNNFLVRGSTVSFEPTKDDDPEDGEDDKDDRDDGAAPIPDPNAEDRIPVAWRTVDRVLDVVYRNPRKESETLSYAEFSRKKDWPEEVEEQLKLVELCKIKWCDLAYRECTDEAPPTEDEDGHEAYVAAYKAFLEAISPEMSVPHLTKQQMSDLDKPRDVAKFVPMKEQPEGISGGKLMDFQLEGINFLHYQWWQRTGCILADEMGLGKTCQIISHLVNLRAAGARPFLVAVPNSLIGNWMREFARWAPSMRIVPYNGDAHSRKIIEKYELFDASGSLKTHVVLVTYEALQGNTAVLRKVDRWDTLVVDEGQRLKSGKDSQLFSAIGSLNIGHRILLSGTPLNNNLREVFNLLAFINPGKFPHVEELTLRFAELTPALVEEVRDMLKPYFLRRTKHLVLKLPPLTEVVVPVSMTVLQRKLYRGILERNASAIQSMVQTKGSKSRKPKKGNFANVLMELRKSLCHPYLVSPDIEPRTASPEEALVNLTDASAKLVLLNRMLPKLKAAGHRILIFSQFKIVLNILERFVSGLKIKYLRLDGDTPQIDRQRDVDKFNAPGSEFFAYLLSTRAGGVGLNITSADVVIIFDQDFNPQQDLQAISRAHRIGQTKPVRVFKLLVQGTCEEKIFNAGNKKLGLEHLIIQRIDAKDESEDVESILQHGAKAVFGDDAAAEASAIRYSDSDIDDLLKKTAADSSALETEAAGTFAQAQVWAKEKVGDDAPTEGEQGGDLHDFWSKVVEGQQAMEKQKKEAAAANVGRGKRTRNQVNYRVDVGAPQKKSGKAGSASPSVASGHSSGEEYRHQADEIESEDEYEPMDVDDLPLGIDGPQCPLPLARLEPAPPVDKTSPEYQAALQRKRDARKQRVDDQFKMLHALAVKANDQEAITQLNMARAVSTKSIQTTVLMQVTQRLRLQTQAMNGILNPLPNAANQGAPTSAAVAIKPKKVASTSADAAAALAKKAVKAAKRRDEEEAAVKKAQEEEEAQERRKAEEKRQRKMAKKAAKAEAQRLLTSAVAAASAASTSASTAAPSGSGQPSKPKSKSPLPSTADSATAAAKAAAPSLKRRASDDPPSDASSNQSTSKYVQSTLSFGAKVSPPVSGASTSQARPPSAASTSQARPPSADAPKKRTRSLPAPSSSKPKPSSVVPAKKASPPLDNTPPLQPKAIVKPKSSSSQVKSTSTHSKASSSDSASQVKASSSQPKPSTSQPTASASASRREPSASSSQPKASASAPRKSGESSSSSAVPAKRTFSSLAAVQAAKKARSASPAKKQKKEMQVIDLISDSE